MSTTTLTLTLSFIAGLVDVTSFLLVNGLFAAHITGNIVVMAADVASHRPVRLATGLAVVVFVAVTAAFTVAVDTSRRAPYRWAQPFLWLQFAFLATTAVSAPVIGLMGWHGTLSEVMIAVLAVAAMACQNALLHLTLTRAPSTAVMTGNIVASTVALVGLALAGLGVHRARPRPIRWKADRVADRSDWGAIWPLLLGFVAGCVIGALACSAATWWAWIGPALVSGALAMLATRADLPDQLRRET